MKMTAIIDEGKTKVGIILENALHILKNPFESYANENFTGEVFKNKEQFIFPFRPTKIICVAMNYHAASGVTDDMLEPLIFIKGPNALTDKTDIAIPFNLNCWGESELAFVISRQAKNVTLENAKNYILGYCPANDVSIENIHGRDHHLARSKSPDNFCPVSPIIETEFTFGDKKIRSYHNGELLREEKLQNMIMSPEKLVCLISSWMTLMPGDIVLTGAPPRTRERSYVKEGDIFSVEIEGFPPLVSRFYEI